MYDTSAGGRQEQVQDAHTYVYITHIHTLVLGDDKKKFKTRSGEVTKLVDLLDEVRLELASSMRYVLNLLVSLWRGHQLVRASLPHQQVGLSLARSPT